MQCAPCAPNGPNHLELCVLQTDFVAGAPMRLMLRGTECRLLPAWLGLELLTAVADAAAAGATYTQLQFTKPAPITDRMLAPITYISHPCSISRAGAAIHRPSSGAVGVIVAGRFHRRGELLSPGSNSHFLLTTSSILARF